VLYRTVVLLSVGWILVTGILLAFVVTTSWLGTRWLEQVSQHVTFTVELEAAEDALARASQTRESRHIAQHAETLADLASSRAQISRESADRLKSAAAILKRDVFGEAGADATEMNSAVSEALSLVRQALRLEIVAGREAFDELSENSDRQLVTVTILALIIPAATLVVLLLFRRRVLRPLRDLQNLIGRLSRKDYDAAITDDVDPLMAPLFDTYNRMVKRMRDLDEGHAKREDVLQADVEKAGRALFQQQRALARADRLAALGELTARLAHDLRNPLSGVLMALTNMRDEVDSAEHSDRLTTAIEELERIARTLTNIVNESRIVPERPQRLQISGVVDELVKLLRYQLSSNVTLTTDVPEDIYCRLPDVGFRHVLLNMVSNAAQAIGERPGTIEIAAALTEGHAELVISDDGPGFPEELMEAGVHEYGSWRKGGTGLGLATARRFAREHGSRLELKNKPDGGATVILRLPVEDCDNESPGVR